MGRTTAWCFCRRLQGFRGQGWKYTTLFVLWSRVRPMYKANAFVPTLPTSTRTGRRKRLGALPNVAIVYNTALVAF